MTLEEKEKIYSEDYANAILEYHRNDASLGIFLEQTLNIIDQKYGVVYFPIKDVTTSITTEFGYAIIPKLYGLLSNVNLNAMGVDKVRSNPFLSLEGEGVLLGFVDTGIDYLNPIFQYADQTTRIVSIWDQEIQNLDAGERTFNYGTEYKREQINEAIKSEVPYEVVPSRDENGHGTMLAGVSGGRADDGNEFQGVVPRAEYVIVKLKQAKKNLRNYFSIPDEVYCYQSDDIMFGIQYLVSVAAELKRPIVICIGLGTNQGAHDGSDILSRFLDMVGNRVGRAIIVAAGNEGNSKKHFYGTIDPVFGSEVVELNIGEDEKGFVMEIWGYAPATYSIDILSPTGEYIPKIMARLGESREIPFLFENTTVLVDYLVIEAQSGDPLVLLRFITPAAGIWKFRVYARGASNLRFHIWLPISNFISDGTYFIYSNPDTTITSPGNANFIVTATAYSAVTNNIYISASRGYTKNWVIKPDVAAPGVDVLVPTLGNQYIRASGTSIAAAHVTGIAAMLMEWGVVKENYSYIGSVQIQRFLIRGVTTQIGIIYPNNIWGYGSVNIYNTLLSLSILPEDT